MKKYSQGGFTLIELLVVIAIIGILSSVVLASLSTARNKASDAKIRSQLTQAKTSAELYANNNGGSYTASNMAAAALPCTGTMFADAASGMLILTGTAASWPTGTLLSCQATATGFSISANLPGGGFWCVDSAGKNQAAAAQQASADVDC